MFAKLPNKGTSLGVQLNMKDFAVPNSQPIFYNCPTSNEDSSTILYQYVDYPDLFSQKYLIYEAPTCFYDGYPAQYFPLPYPSSDDSKTKLNFPHITFNSNFESGNLARAVSISPYEYNLLLRPDADTQIGNQWFYFEFDLPESNIRKNIKFNILNNIKPASLFSQGMQPVIYCYDCATKGHAIWKRKGFNISYYKNNFERRNPQNNVLLDNYYTLTFTFSCEHAGKHRISYSYPYTYSDLLLYLKHIKQHPTKSYNCKISYLCRTIGNRICPLLTITDFSNSTYDIYKTRPIIVFTGRVHPGETPGSWIMLGLIDELLGSSPIAQELRKTFIFKIVPMLNPDGVAVGNSRCSLAGVDLNRFWNHPNPNFYAPIYYTKDMIKKMAHDGNVVFFCDIHGHSRDKDIFLYGCDQENQLIQSFMEQLKTNEFHDYLNYSSCSFQVQKAREGTARVVVHKEFNIPLSFTLEASCCGGSIGSKYENLHYNIKNYKEIGTLFARSMIHLKNLIPLSPPLPLSALPKVIIKKKPNSQNSQNININDHPIKLKNIRATLPSALPLLPEDKIMLPNNSINSKNNNLNNNNRRKVTSSKLSYNPYGYTKRFSDNISLSPIRLNK